MEASKIFTTNKYGVSIVKCCASCKFRQLDNRIRLCTAGEGSVPSSYVCNSWEINPTYENVGKGDGNIKTSEYLHYALDRLFDDYNTSVAASQNGIIHKRLSIADIRKEFAKHNGTIYAIEKK